MAEIEINVDEIKKATAVFDKAMDEYKAAIETYASAVGGIDDMNSDYVNQLKSLLKDMSVTVSKNMTNTLTNYRDGVEAVVEGFEETEQTLIGKLFYQNNPMNDLHRYDT